MKQRVHINTPGKVISYRDYPPLRSPVFIDVEDDSVEGFKRYLEMMGISDYTIEIIEDNISVPPSSRKVSGLHRKILSGPGSGGGAKLNIK